MLGEVGSLWRYPVKSLRGEQREWLDINARGVERDRIFAIRNEDGKLASGKNTRRFFKLDGLFELSAAYESDIPVISFLGGSILHGNQSDIDAALSKAFGQSLTLVRESGISHLDAGPVHLLTTASLAWLRSAIPDVQVDERRFRPNVLIDASGATEVEKGWLGKTLSIGSEVVLRVTSLTERCAMVVYPQSNLPYDERILRSIVQEANLSFGVYAEVLTPGRIRHGDNVTAVD
jgi:uncharacterized protein YcbX